MSGLSYLALLLRELCDVVDRVRRVSNQLQGLPDRVVIGVRLRGVLTQLVQQHAVARDPLPSPARAWR